jgi:hypothetical protein
MDAVELANELKSRGHLETVKVTGYFKDSKGETTQSVPLYFDIEKWLKGEISDYRRSPFKTKGEMEVEVFIPNKDNSLNPNHEPLVVFDIKNISEVAITIKDIGFETSGRSKIVLSNITKDLKLPYKISPRKTCSFSINPKQIASSLLTEGFKKKVKIAWFLEDSDGNIYKNRLSKFNIDEWTSLIN